MSSRFLVGVLLFATAARAQLTAQDNFEGKLLKTDSPPGIWDFLVQQEAANLFGTSAAGAKTGNFGLHTVDSTAGNTYLTANGLLLAITPDAGQVQQYERFWFRGSNHNGLSQTKITSIDLDPIGLPAAEIYYSNKLLQLDSFDRTGSSTQIYSQVLATDGEWVLIELFATGAGTMAGAVSLAINGQLKSTTKGINWMGQHLAGFTLGNMYGLGDFQATLDFDNYVAAPVPQAAVLALVGPAVIAPGNCVPYSIQVRNSFDGGLAPTLASTFVLMTQSSDAGVLFFDNAACSPSVPGFLFGAGSTGTAVFVRAAANERITLGTQNPDFPDFTISVLVDGGPGIGDAGLPDAGAGDAGAIDAGGSDGGQPGMGDAGGFDAGIADAGVSDAVSTDAGAMDSGTPDAGAMDAGVGPANLTVGCGCNSGAGKALLALLGIFVLGRRRRGTS